MEEIKGKIHLPNPPRILLEVLSARATLVILGATYIVFLMSFIFDVTTTLGNFSGGDIKLGMKNCETLGFLNPDDVWTSGGEWGCQMEFDDISNHPQQHRLWIGRTNNLSNVISVGLRYRATNITSLEIGNVTIDISNSNQENFPLIRAHVEFDVDLYACFQKNYCSKNGVEESRWIPVLTKNNQRLHLLEFFDPISKSISLDVISNTFQNQESLPTKSLVQSYLMFVFYNMTSSITALSSGGDDEDMMTMSPNGFYQFTSISRPSTTIGNLLRPILLSVTMVVAVWYTYSIYSIYPNISNWLRERKWILFYFFALLLYQNPVYCVICHMKRPSGLWIFLSYALDAFSQASFFLVWLLFSDGIRRKSYVIMFYLPKIFITLLIFLTNLGILMMQFPSVGFTSDRSSSLAAVYNWSKDTKVTFIFFSLSFFSLIIGWFLWWLTSLYLTGSTLQQVPYMSTRYLQLSFRFFCLQATFVTTYYFLEYGVVVYLILRNSPPVQTQHLNNLSDNINTLFRHQTLLVGKVFFLTIYSILLAFLFLPAHTGSRGDALQILSAAYAVTEDDLDAIIKMRRKSISNQMALSNITHTKAEIFCVSLAQRLLHASYEVYYDMPSLTTPSGFGPANWERHNYTVIADIYNDTYDTYCCIVCENLTKRIVVAFRGSCSTQHWQNNFDYSLKYVDIRSLSLPQVDDGDGLEIGHYIDLRYDGIDVEEEEERPEQRSPNPVTAMTDTLREVVDVTSGVVVGATNTVLGATSEFLTAAVAHTPGINTTVQIFVHSGFWNSYCAVREFIHIKLRETLSKNSTQVFFTGHSLGGALATFAALDFTIHSLDRINKYVRHRKIRAPITARKTRSYQDTTVAMYNFGSPKIGNWKFAQLYDELVPNSFRVVTDGDIVCGLPPTMSYFHIGTEILIDSQGAGTIIIDPSFVERRLRTRVSTSISVHAMSVYELGLDRIFESSQHLLVRDENSQNSQVHSFDEVVNWESDQLSQFSEFLSEEKRLESKSTFVPLSQESSHGKDLEWNNKLDISDSSKHTMAMDERTNPTSSAPLAPPAPIPTPILSSSTNFFSTISMKIFQRFRMNEDEISEILVSKIPRRVPVPVAATTAATTAASATTRVTRNGDIVGEYKNVVDEESRDRKQIEQKTSLINNNILTE